MSSNISSTASSDTSSTPSTPAVVPAISCFALLDHSYLFSHLSQFISIEDKCSRVIHLNRALSKAFASARDQCCRNDTLLLRWRTGSRSDESAWATYPAKVFAQRMSYAPLVKRIVALQANILYGSRYDWCRSDEWLIKAVNGPNLESLYLQEVIVDSPNGSASCSAGLLHHLDKQLASSSVSHPASALRELALVWGSSRDYQWHALDWHGLTAFRSLTTLLIDIPRWRLHDAVPISSMLPPSLVDISIRGVDVCSCYVQEWIDSLLDPAFLPVVRTLDLDAMPISEGVRTVMNSTSITRPMEKMRLIVGEVSQAEALAEMPHLTDLDLLIQSQLFGYMHSMQQGAPKLKSLKLAFLDEDDAIDTQPFFEFLPRFDCCLENLDFTLGILVSQESIKSLSRLSSLTSLSISSESCLNLRSMEHLAFSLEANCWPMLKSLKFSDLRCGEQCLSRLLTAAPSLTKLTLIDVGVSSATALALVGYQCPRLVQLIVKGQIAGSRSTSMLSLAHVQSVFSDFPPSVDAFQHLFLVDVSDVYADTAWHLLLSKLKTAPQLRFFKNMQRSDVSVLAMASLPNLRALWAAPSNTLHSVYESRCGGRTQDLVYLEYENTRTKPLPPPFGPVLDPFLPSTLLADRIGFDNKHLVFRKSVNDKGLDGRASFFAKLASDPAYADACEKLKSWDRSYRAKRKTPTPKPSKALKEAKLPSDKPKRHRKV